LRVVAVDGWFESVHCESIVAVAGGSDARARVVIAGGGFAAVEAALALRALAGERAQVTLISPSLRFAYRPAATTEAFSDAPPRAYDLEAIAGELGAVCRRDRLEAVAPAKKLVRLASGARLGYDALILALGARTRAGVPGALTFRDQRDVPRFRGLWRELETLPVARLVFAVPSGCTWSLPIYELALLSCAHAAERHAEVEVTVVSPERTPLAVFGAEASRLVADLLAERGVRFVGGAAAYRVRRDGALVVQFDGEIEADGVVAAPHLHANRVTGVPASWWGFVPTDDCGRVEGLQDVYAAGDMTTDPIKQAGLAAQQADRIAETIAAALGVPVREFRAARVLGARLLGGAHPLFLCVEIDALGHPATATLVHKRPTRQRARPRCSAAFSPPTWKRTSGSRTARQPPPNGQTTAHSSMPH
jgi:sulfide:quinone oxidoreductase